MKWLEKLIVNTMTAAGLKIVCGSDDLVWLAPFFASESTPVGKLKVAGAYALSVSTLVLVAAVLGLIIHSVVAGVGGHEKEINFWIEIAAAALLGRCERAGASHPPPPLHDTRAQLRRVPRA